MTIYRVADWDKVFEGAKSRTYNNKTSCQIPNKHGLGYRKLIRRKDGPAIFGAWCALVQVLSRQEKPRQGYCTDTGRILGKPYTPEDLELLTDIPAKYFSALFDVCSQPSVGWLLTEERIPEGYRKDTTGIPQYPLDSDSDSDLDSDLDSDSNNCSETDQPPSEPPVLTIPLIPRDGEYAIFQKDIDGWSDTFPGVDVLAELKKCRQWNLDEPRRRKTRQGIRKHISGWLGRSQNRGSPRKPQVLDFTKILEGRE